MLQQPLVEGAALPCRGIVAAPPVHHSRDPATCIPLLNDPKLLESDDLFVLAHATACLKGQVSDSFQSLLLIRIASLYT